MKLRHEAAYSAGIALGRALFGFWRLKRRASGLTHIPDAGGAVLAMTHFGYLDFALVEWAIWLRNRRRIRFLAKKGVFENPLAGSLLRGMGHIPVDMKAGAAAYREAIGALRSGELVGVFPEAGVSASFTVRKLKTGAVRLAAEAQVPVIPVATWGGQRLLTKNHKVPFRDRFEVPVWFAFGAPMTIPASDDAQEATARLRSELQRLVDSLQSRYPVDGAGAWWQPRHLGGTAPTPDEAAAADAERDRRRDAARGINPDASSTTR